MEHSPVFTAFNADFKRYVQFCNAFHFSFEKRLYSFAFFKRTFQNQFVMYLKKKFCLEFLLNNTQKKLVK